MYVNPELYLFPYFEPNLLFYLLYKIFYFPEHTEIEGIRSRPARRRIQYEYRTADPSDESSETGLPSG